MTFKEDIQIYPPIRFDEFFGCHRKFKDEREIKGIYYSRSTATFYIIINRFYLKIEGDLVANSFQINDNAYRKALSLKLVSRAGTPTLEILKTKWVKTLRLNAYLVTDHDTFSALNSDKFNLNDLYVSTEPNSIVNCDYQTLSIEDNVFCFTDKE